MAIEKDLKTIIEEAKQQEKTVLYLFGNKLESFPLIVTEIISLEDLNLGGNQLTELPSEISKLINLKKLDLGWDPTGDNRFNKLVVLPPEIGLLTNLEFLNLSHNKINNLPPEIGQLKNLQSLYLDKNRLSKLPVEIRSLANLKYLDLRDNPLPIPPEILSKTKEPQIILDYYFSLSKKCLNEVKILVVGQGSVGKTSIIQRLTSNSFNSNENKTEGISIKQWIVKNKLETQNQSPNIRLNLWDFGGQEIMHATHQFFLTKRSLYLLVLDSRLTQEENRVEYWLKIIQSFGGESPVLIVGNKIDEHPLDIDRTGLQMKYSNIVGVLESSAATGAGIEELKTTITELVNNLPHVHDLLPETWFTVKTKLEEQGKEFNFITHDKYLDLCIENEVTDETSQGTLIGFLHDLGVVLHFQDDPRLEALGILNPQWVTNGVYKILNSHALFQNKGVLESSMLDETLNYPEYPSNKRLFIVDMMRKFELCYDIDPDKTFLVPDLLPKDEPFTGEWDGALAFQYHFNILPSSIITRFIVRMNVFIYKTIWRTGVILKKGGNTALVKADVEDKKVSIWVNGDETTRRDLLSAIRVEFDGIHKTIVKIDAVEKVPHPSYPEVIFDYKELIQFERDGITEFPKSINGKSTMVSVRQLLNGVERETDRRRGRITTNVIIHGNVDGSTIITGDENEVKS